MKIRIEVSEIEVDGIPDQVTVSEAQVFAVEGGKFPDVYIANIEQVSKNLYSTLLKVSPEFIEALAHVKLSPQVVNPYKSGKPI